MGKLPLETFLEVDQENGQLVVKSSMNHNGRDFTAETIFSEWDEGFISEYIYPTIIPMQTKRVMEMAANFSRKNG